MLVGEKGMFVQPLDYSDEYCTIYVEGSLKDRSLKPSVSHFEIDEHEIWSRPVRVNTDDNTFSVKLDSIGGRSEHSLFCHKKIICSYNTARSTPINPIKMAMFMIASIALDMKPIIYPPCQLPRFGSRFLF